MNRAILNSSSCKLLRMSLRIKRMSESIHSDVLASILHGLIKGSALRLMASSINVSLITKRETNVKMLH